MSILRAAAARFASGSAASEEQLEFERTVQAAVTARISELADELGVDLAEKHQEMLERLQRRDDVSEEQLGSARVRHAEDAEDMDKLRVLFCQF